MFNIYNIYILLFCILYYNHKLIIVIILKYKQFIIIHIMGVNSCIHVHIRSFQLYYVWEGLRRLLI